MAEKLIDESKHITMGEMIVKLLISPGNCTIYWVLLTNIITPVIEGGRKREETCG